MFELIAVIIFFVSLAGIVFILYSKIPALVQMPQSRLRKSKQSIVFQAEEKIKDFYGLFFKQKFLHKLLSWLKIITLKIETRIDTLLHRIRKSAKEQKLNKKK